MDQKFRTFLFYQVIVIFLLLNTIDLGADDNLNILSIKPVPEIKIIAPLADEKVLFENRGTIQRIGKDEVGKKLIVIDDRLRYFAAEIKYYNIEGAQISPTGFHKGKTVGYSLNNKKEITGLYLIIE